MSNESRVDEILEGNYLINEFMGSRVIGQRYHDSWNNLMPVIRKIADLLLNKDWDNLQNALARWKPIANELQNVNLKNTWYCVVQFLNWYNNQPKTK